MFGPGGASGPYTLVMPERCIPCERILCERYTNGAALLLSLVNNMNVDMGDIRSHHFRNVVYHVWPGGASGPYTLVMPERCIP